MIRPEFGYLCKHIEDNYNKFDLRDLKSGEKEKSKLLLNKWHQEMEIEKQKLEEKEKKV